VTPDQAMMLRRGVIELRRLLGEPPILQNQMPVET
jgi:hypothetical protein